MKFKMRTERAEWAGLCGDCVHGMAVEQESGARYLECNASYGATAYLPTSKVRSCSKYAKKDSLNMHTLEAMAWTLEVKGKTIMGFKPPGAKKPTYDE